MRPSHPISATTALREAIGLGCLAGLLHALAETAFLRWHGIRPTGFDLGVIAVASCAAGIVFALVAFLAVLVLSRRIKGTIPNSFAFRLAAWSILIACYSLVFLRIAYYWSGFGALLWLTAAAPALAIAWVAVRQKGQRAVVLLWSTFSVAATFCALQLAHAESGLGSANPKYSLMWLLVPIGACVATFVAAKRTSADHAFEPVTRVMAPMLVLLGLWTAFWATPGSGLSLNSSLRSGPRDPGSRPNILLIVLDTVRADHLDLFGYKRQTMPNLRRFATEECQTVNRMLTTGAWTLPSHASMFTGLYPSAHGAHYPFLHDTDAKFLAYSIREDVPTLAEFLASLGYQTAGIAANFGILSQFGLSRGFQHYDLTPGSAYLAPGFLWLYRLRVGESSPGKFFRQSFPARLQGWSRLFSVREPDYRRAWEITDTARSWLIEHGGAPFFLFLNYFDAHEPYLPPAEDSERFAKRPDGDEWFGFPTKRFAESKVGEATFTEQEIEFLKAQYDSELVSMDRELGRLFEFLDESGLTENTLIFVTTDHGEAFFEHGFPVHGNSLYQPETGGFLLIKAPPALGPASGSPTMQFVDFFPTIAAVLGEPLPHHAQGIPWGTRDYALAELFCKSCGHESLEPGWPDALRRELAAVMIGSQKLIRSTNEPDNVYDLTADPGETRPLAAPDPEQLHRSEEIFIERNKSLVEGLSANPDDKNLLDKLRSLGYVR